MGILRSIGEFHACQSNIVNSPKFDLGQFRKIVNRCCRILDYPNTKNAAGNSANIII